MMLRYLALNFCALRHISGPYFFAKAGFGFINRFLNGFAEHPNVLLRYDVKTMISCRFRQCRNRLIRNGVVDGFGFGLRFYSTIAKYWLL